MSNRFHLKYLIFLGASFMIFGCSSKSFDKTVDFVDLQRFMGKWYVWAGRTTFLEKGANNSVEVYTWNQKENRIDVDFSFRKNSFDGEVKRLPQKAWIENEQTKAHWKIQLFWPFKANYLIIGLDRNYEWTAVGVPSGDYLWIKGREPIVSDEKLSQILKQVEEGGYPVQDVPRIPQNGE